MHSEATTIAPEQPAHRRGGLVGPTILIGLGVIFLLNNLNLLNWGVWVALLRLWPVLLIAVGLDILFGRRSLIGSLLIAGMLVLAIAAAVWSSHTGLLGGVLLTDQQINQPLDGASRAEIQLGHGVGTLRLGAMTEPEGLIAGTVTTEEGEQVTRDFSVRDGTAYFKLVSERRPVVFWPSVGNSGNTLWDLRLNPATPLRLELDSGVGTTSANLTALQVTELTVNSGVGDINLTLPERGQVTARINGGIGKTAIVIPRGMAARIEVDSGLGRVNVTGNYRHEDNRYISPDYATAANRVDLVISGGIGDIQVRQGQ